MTDKDKTVGGWTREEWVDWFTPYVARWRPDIQASIKALIDAAFDSRGVRDGLERAAEMVAEGAKSFREHPTQGDRETALLLGRLADAFRAEASKLDGEEGQ
jgi:hypothetical protein